MSTLPIAVRCVSHVGMTVSDLKASVDFFIETLGFTKCFEDIEEGWARVGLAKDEVVVELFSPFPDSSPQESLDPFYPGSYGQPKLALTVPDAEAAHKQLSESGIAPLCEVTTTSVSKFFFIADPNGTLIQLQEFFGGRARLTEIMGARGADTSKLIE